MIRDFSLIHSRLFILDTQESSIFHISSFNSYF